MILGGGIPLKEMHRLYNREKLSVARIAKHFDVTRQAIYDRMWRSEMVPMARDGNV